MQRPLEALADPEHRRRVARIADQVRSRPAGSRISISKSTRTHSIRDQSYKATSHMVHVDGLDTILHIDAAARCAVVEGQVQLGELCAATLEQGLLPAVVPEFHDFTVAGLINGDGVQSSSHRYGTFGGMIVAAEVLLGDGSTVVASEEEHAGLLRGMVNSLGTLGIVAAAALPLVPALPYVRSRYQRFGSLAAYGDALQGPLGGPAFVEGVVYGPDEYVLITSEFAADGDGLPDFHPSLPGEPYYYQHAQAAAPGEDIIPTLEYLTRSERGLWWLLECHVGLPMLTETRWGRRTIDRSMTQRMLRGDGWGSKLSVMDRERAMVLQDVGFSLERLAEGVSWVQRELGVYPIWNCPIVRPEGNYIVDVGVYGEPRAAGYEPVRKMRELQLMCDFASTWGVSYMTHEEWRAAGQGIRDEYEALRRDYLAEDAFLHVQDKVLWVDPEKPTPGKLRLWRLKRSFGPRWYVRPAALLTLALGLAATAIWRGWLAVSRPRRRQAPRKRRLTRASRTR